MFCPVSATIPARAPHAQPRSPGRPCSKSAHPRRQAPPLPDPSQQGLRWRQDAQRMIGSLAVTFASRRSPRRGPGPPGLGRQAPKPLRPSARPRSSNLLPTLANTFVNLRMCLSSVSRNLFLQSLPRPAPAGRRRSSSTSPRAGAGLAASQPGKASAARQGAECGSGSRTQPRRPTQGVGWSAVAGPPPPLERSC